MWQPIETAPKDQFLLLCGPSGYTTVPMVVTTGRMCSNYHAGRWIDHANDDLTDWGFVPTHWMPMLTAPNAQPAPMAVAYLDLGAGGYMDIGTDLTDEALAALPKGRHLLGIVGTYGVEGYIPAQPAPSVPSVEAAEAMGEKGGPVVEAERVAFEAWMRGHCWNLCAEWTGTQYLGAFEKDGMVDTRAMRTREIWAAWRDRAALAAAPEAKP